jgi:predicted nucleic acid-binding protein
MYLLDTNVVSEFRRRRPHPAVVAWVERLPDEQLHVSAMTLGELQAGVEITREQDEDKALEIEAWVDRLAETYNVIPLDGRAFRVWARLMHRRRDDLIPDALIAATAIVHDLTVATRNVRGFDGFGVAVVDPFAEPIP